MKCIMVESIKLSTTYTTKGKYGRDMGATAPLHIPTLPLPLIDVYPLQTKMMKVS